MWYNVVCKKVQAHSSLEPLLVNILLFSLSLSPFSFIIIIITVFIFSSILLIFVHLLYFIYYYFFCLFVD